MELEKDEIWNGFTAITTLQSFRDGFLDQLYFRDEVAEEIKVGGQQVQKLLVHSYYEYSFLEIAITQSIFLLDKALSTRWQEIHGKKPKLNFEMLIDWFFVNDYFEILDVQQVHSMRKFRNQKVHSLVNATGGIAVIRKVYWIFDLINGLYEQPELRVARMNMYYRLTKQFAEFVKNGVIITTGDKKFIAFAVSPIFVNNKFEPVQLYLFVALIFNLNNQQDGRVCYSNLSFCVSNWMFDGNHFKAVNEIDKTTFKISKITDRANREKYQTWKSDLNRLKDFSLLLFEIFEPIPNLQTKYLRALHMS